MHGEAALCGKQREEGRPETETLQEVCLCMVEGCLAECAGQLVLDKVDLKSLFLGGQTFQRSSSGTVVQSWRWGHDVHFRVSTFI